MTELPQGVHEDSTTVGRGFLSLNKHGEPGKEYYTGVYVGSGGVARVYRQDGYTRIDVVSGKRLRMASWKRWLGDRTISRVARILLEKSPHA